jgi:hypothetical protein
VNAEFASQPHSIAYRALISSQDRAEARKVATLLEHVRHTVLHELARLYGGIFAEAMTHIVRWHEHAEDAITLDVPSDALRDPRRGDLVIELYVEIGAFYPVWPHRHTTNLEA